MRRVHAGHDNDTEMMRRMIVIIMKTPMMVMMMTSFVMKTIDIVMMDMSKTVTMMVMKIIGEADDEEAAAEAAAGTRAAGVEAERLLGLQRAALAESKEQASRLRAGEPSRPQTHGPGRHGAGGGAGVGSSGSYWWWCAQAARWKIDSPSACVPGQR